MWGLSVGHVWTFPACTDIGALRHASCVLVPCVRHASCLPFQGVFFYSLCCAVFACLCHVCEFLVVHVKGKYLPTISQRFFPCASTLYMCKLFLRKRKSGESQTGHHIWQFRPIPPRVFLSNLCAWNRLSLCLLTCVWYTGSSNPNMQETYHVKYLKNARLQAHMCACAYCLKDACHKGRKISLS